ncbi:MAG: phosphate acetyltransferase [Campylobacterales bacterium]|nr:phosphate acetyltransferase [Campylobacterales bacterium]
MKNLYITSSSSHNGTLIVAMGIMEILKRNLRRIAFFRPIIKNREHKDNSIEFIRKHFSLDLEYEDCYSFRLDEYQELVAKGERDEAIKKIIAHYNKLEEEHDFVLVEGLSSPNFLLPQEYEINYQIAKNIGSAIINIINIKDHSTQEIREKIEMEQQRIAQLHLSHLATFLNRASDEHIAAYRRSKHNLLFLPEIEELNYPTVEDIAHSLKAKIVLGSDTQLGRIIKRNKIGSMHIEHLLKYIQRGDLFVTSGDRTDVILGIVSANYSKDFPSIAGLVLTGGFELEEDFLKLLKGLKQFTIPILSVQEDSYTTVTKLQKLGTYISLDNYRKVALAMGVFSQYVDSSIIENLIAKKVDKNLLTPLMFEYRTVKKAQSNLQRIVLPESQDERILQAAEILLRRGVVEVILLCEQEELCSRSKDLGLDLSSATVINPKDKTLIKKYGKEFYRLRKHKGVTLEGAMDLMGNINYFATMMIHFGDADGMVSGAIHTTAETIRPALQIIKTKPNIDLVSSLFFMLLDERVLVYADCAINQNPTPKELAQIAISSAGSAKAFGIEPKVAMLSYSTGSSGSGEDVQKVIEATKIAKEMAPELLIEGPIQYDAAIDKGVAKTKLPNSAVAGEATVLIFPDLNTGNNTYKAVQRSSNAIAIGPILQGLNKPINDLSRGCKVEDIVNTVVITAIQAMEE